MNDARTLAIHCLYLTIRVVCSRAYTMWGGGGGQELCTLKTVMVYCYFDTGSFDTGSFS